MGTKIEYVESSHLYATNYIRNSKAIAVLWAIFTICYAIISTVAFLTPEWVGDMDSDSAGRLGLWQVCQKDDNENCQKQFSDMLSVPSVPFQVATVIVGISVITAVMTICSLILFMYAVGCKYYLLDDGCQWLFIGMSKALHEEALHRNFSDHHSTCMIVGCVAFPFGWNSNEFRKICGPESNRFELGLCGIRWAYPLAIIACIDGCILATLAFILATRHVRLQPEPMYQSSMYKGEINNAYLTTDAVSIAGSRKSMNLQPVLLVASPHHNIHDDTISQFSSRTATRYNRPDYHNSMHQFQL